MTTSVRCAIYTRKSSEEGLEQSFNSLDAQREACEAYILSQQHEGWKALSTKYDDGGFSGGNMVRPALAHLLEDIAAKRVDTVVVYKVDRLTRSLADFAKIVEQFDKQGVSFVSVTQQFNTTSSMGRLTLNVLLSFAQFEREVTGERIRDKIAASKRKGMWMGGVVPMGYDLQDHQLILNVDEATLVKKVYEAYLKQGCVSKLQDYLELNGILSKRRTSKTGNVTGGKVFGRGSLYLMLRNRVYRGEISHKGASYPGQQPAIIDQKLWDQVQAHLKDNSQSEGKRPRKAEKSFLVGLLYDVDGNRFTPSYAMKRGRRYRYYVSQAAIKKRLKASPGPTRLPAKQIEHLVIAEMNALLRSPDRILQMVDPAPRPADIQHMLEAVAASANKAHDLIVATVRKIIIHHDRIDIQMGKGALLKAIFGDTMDPKEGDEILSLDSKAALKRFGGETRFLLPPDSNGQEARPTPSLVRAIARAHDWMELVLRGEVADQRALAKQTGYDERYISRLLPLAFLAPDLTEAVLDGKIPSHLGLGDCLGNIAIDWAQQRLSFLGP